MTNTISEICAFFCLLDFLLSLIIIYKIVKAVAEPKTIKGRIISAVVSVCLLAVIYTELTNIFPKLGDLQSFTILIYIPVFFVLFCILFHKRLIKHKYSIEQLDSMEGHDFEYACADILRANCFNRVTVTQGSGDYGVDIIAYKGGFKYAIQCKRYSHKLDNTPIQEVLGGLKHWNCNKAAVMTNQYFTEPAKLLAKENGVVLWDRTALQKML